MSRKIIETYLKNSSKWEFESSFSGGKGYSI
jgi:hypothetical protein